MKRILLSAMLLLLFVAGGLRAQTAPDAPELTKLLKDFLAGAGRNDAARHSRQRQGRGSFGRDLPRANGLLPFQFDVGFTHGCRGFGRKYSDQRISEEERPFECGIRIADCGTRIAE